MKGTPVKRGKMYRLAYRHVPVCHGHGNGSAWLCWPRQPLQPAFDTQPTLIEMGDRGRDELLADAFQSGVQFG